jgi:hypothetical protein
MEPTTHSETVVALLGIGFQAKRHVIDAEAEVHRLHELTVQIGAELVEAQTQLNTAYAAHATAMQFHEGVERTRGAVEVMEATNAD